MPLYEYECFVCGHRFERIQRFSDPPASKCPACGGSVRRLLGVPALQFKGSGFYITDYGKSDGTGSRPSSSAKEESPPTASESTAKPKPDAKPAAEVKGGGSSKKPA
jgi:putative FmdB family regulatory protein